MRKHEAQARGERRLSFSPLDQGRFGRMFRRLQPAPELPDELLTEIAECMRDRAGAQSSAGDNPEIPAAYTYLGQFADHDLTFDPASSQDRLNDPDALVDFRSPRFDLDCVYGSGPVDEPFQYEADAAHLLVEPNVLGEPDLPRNSRGTALIGEPRNDQNVILSQLHVVFIRLHNALVDRALTAGMTPGDAFPEAQRQARWHYQWVLIHDFLPRIVGAQTFAQVLTADAEGLPVIRRRHYRPKTGAYLPIEYSGAAGRYGPSQVRATYDLNSAVTGRPLLGAADDRPDAPSLRGCRPIPLGWTIEWPRFVSIHGSAPQLSRRIDGRLAPALFGLVCPPIDSLAALNLRRGQALGLPSGQDVARFLGCGRVLTGADIDAPAPTPLWLYLLKEAELLAGGEHLGPTGGRIVAEVVLGLLELDARSFINVDPQWQPEPPVARTTGELELSDLIHFAVTA
jgi:Animal haem peroxidase